MTQGQRESLVFWLFGSMLAGTGFGMVMTRLLVGLGPHEPFWQDLIVIAAFVFLMMPFAFLLARLAARGIRKAGWRDLDMEPPTWTIR